MEVTNSPASETIEGAKDVKNALEPLALWYQQYSAADPESLSTDSSVIHDLQSDQLDYDQVEFEVQQLVHSADVVRGFCAQCRWLLSHWPSTLEVEDGPDWADAFGRALHTRELEAAARAGCKFCLFLLSKLMKRSLLDTFRKIEIRLCLLGKPWTTTLSIENWGRRQNGSLLWLNLPGKFATNCNNKSAQMCKFYSEIMPPRCK